LKNLDVLMLNHLPSGSLKWNHKSISPQCDPGSLPQKRKWAVFPRVPVFWTKAGHEDSGKTLFLDLYFCLNCMSI
jgi:hypothetical protein